MDFSVQSKYTQLIYCMTIDTFFFLKYIPVPLVLFTSEMGNAYSLVHQK